MGVRVVDMSADPRGGQFEYFRRMTFPFAGITAEVDITDFMAARQGRPFFLSMLYAVTRAANGVPQLRRRIRPDGSIVEYDWCAPSYTAMKPDGVYVYCNVEGDLPYTQFVAQGQLPQLIQAVIGMAHSIRLLLYYRLICSFFHWTHRAASSVSRF